MAARSPPIPLPPFPPMTPASLAPLPLLRAGVFAALAVASAIPLAQMRTDAAGARISDPAPAAASRWQADRDALDQALRARVAAASTPRELWIEGTLDDADPWARVRAFSEARNRVPDEKLFLASLAMACLAPLQPLPDACDATDRLADWAIRDPDNGLPALLLADRARQRNNVASMVAHLEDAATRPRFDDYSNRAAVLLWDAVRDVPGDVDPAARAELAASYGLVRSPYPARQLASLCRGLDRDADNLRKACSAAGNALAQRAATWSLRIAGARLAERSSDAATLAAAQQQVSAVQRRAFECAEAGNGIATGLESADAAVRARAVTQWEARLRKDAQLGEVAACVVG